MRVAVYVHDLRSSGVVRNAIAIADRLAAERPAMLIAGCRHGLFADAATQGRHTFVALAGRAGPFARVVAARRLARWLGDTPTLLISAGNFGHPTAWLACRGKAAVRRIYLMSNEIGRESRTNGLREAWTGRLVADADRVTIVSETVAASPPLAAACRAGKGIIIANGVDVAQARALREAPCPHPWLAPDRAMPVVIGVGRLRPQKDFPLLIAAVAIARKKRRLRLLIVGGGTAAARAELVRLSAAAGIAEDVCLAGETDNVFAWLARADVFALSSRYEGSSVALLEAMASGVAVVATRQAGDAAAVLDQGRFGRLVEGGDAAALAAALIAQTAPDALRPGLRADAYGLDRMLDAYAGLVAEIAGPAG